MKSLVLYHFSSCPFCVRVRDFIAENNIEVEERDTMQDPSAKEALMAIGGKTQVPCLVIDGQPLYESGDIITWLTNNQTA